MVFILIFIAINTKCIAICTIYPYQKVFIYEFGHRKTCRLHPDLIYLQYMKCLNMEVTSHCEKWFKEMFFTKRDISLV